MKILAIARIDSRTTPEMLRPFLEEESRYAWKLYAEGVCRELYDRPDRQGVVFVMECDSVPEARAALAGLPFVREKLIDFDLIPLEPFAYFGMLFRDGESSRRV